MTHDPKVQYALLQKIKEDLTYDRGLRINQYHQAKDHPAKVSEIVEIQNQLDVILRIIADVEGQLEREVPGGLAAFYQKIEDNPKLMDKWYPKDLE